MEMRVRGILDVGMVRERHEVARRAANRAATPALFEPAPIFGVDAFTPQTTPHSYPTLAFANARNYLILKGKMVFGDPNGIRTRVAGVKGRCPRPLDDGVAKRRCV